MPPSPSPVPYIPATLVWLASLIRKANSSGGSYHNVLKGDGGGGGNVKLTLHLHWGQTSQLGHRDACGRLGLGEKHPPLTLSPKGEALGDRGGLVRVTWG